MAKFQENFSEIQNEWPITIIRGGEVLKMTTKQYKAMIKREKAKAKREQEKQAEYKVAS